MYNLHVLYIHMYHIYNMYMHMYHIKHSLKEYCKATYITTENLE